MKNVSSIQPQPASPQHASKGGTPDISIGILILALPIVLAISKLLYKRHQIMKRRQQRETLERIWKLDYQEKAT